MFVINWQSKIKITPFSNFTFNPNLSNILSKNSLQSNNPKPVPVPFSLPFVVKTSDILNSYPEFSIIADVAPFDQKLAREFRKNVSIFCAIRDILS
jgi:hypothetical protein